MSLLALFVKISVPPVLVALMTLAARRWGPTFGGLIMGLPWMTGPVLFFLGLDKGPDFLVEAAKGALFAVWGMGGFILAFGFASRWVNWAGSLAAGVAAFVGVGLLLQNVDASLVVVTAVAALAMLVCAWGLPTPSAAAVPTRPPVWDIAARMAATFALVAVIMLSSDVLGPQRSGLIASFPVIMTVIGSFMRAQYGHDALLRMLRGMSLSLLSFVGFFATVAAAVPSLGQIWAYGLAVLVALAVCGSVIVGTALRTRPRVALG